MLKKTISFQNLDGVTVNKDLYFNISANDLVAKEALSEAEAEEALLKDDKIILTYSERLKAIGATNKLHEVYPLVMEFMQEGYGVRTEDGDFEKDPTGAAWARFKNTLAFDSLMEELLLDESNNGTNLANFLNGMLPEKLVKRVAEDQAANGFRPGANTARPVPPVAGEQPAAVSAPAPAEPIVVAPAEPVAAEPQIQYLENLPENGGSTTIAAPPEQGVVHESAPRDPSLDQ